MFIIGVVSLIVLVAVKMFASPGKKFVPVNNAIPITLAKIYKDERIEPQQDQFSYLIDGTYLWAKEISVGNTSLFLVVEKQQQEYDGRTFYSGTYRFYSSGAEPKLLKEVDLLMPPDNSSKVFDGYLSAKDITGDGIEEIFIKREISSSNLIRYEGLRAENGQLSNITIEGNKDLVFDEINYEGGYVYTTWHGGYEIGKIRYEWQGNNLVPVKSVGFFITPPSYNSENCEIRVSERGGMEKVVGVENCDKIQGNFDPYFINK